MKKARFTETQIVNILKLADSDLSVITACKLTSLSRASFYRRNTDWREKDKAVIDAIHVVLAESPQAGF